MLLVRMTKLARQIDVSTLLYAIRWLLTHFKKYLPVQLKHRIRF
jgi:hypothetical protein